MKYIYNHFMQQYEKELMVAMVTVAMEIVIIPKMKGDGLLILLRIQRRVFIKIIQNYWLKPEVKLLIPQIFSI